MSSPGVEHGTLGGYRGGCRQACCRAAMTGYANYRRRLVAYGRWVGNVDPAAARERLLLLKAQGYSERDLSAATGLNPTHMREITSGRASYIRAETHRAVLAARPRLGATSRVDVTGTRRRLQALGVRGWSPVMFARESGVERSVLVDILGGRRRTIAARTRAAIARAYDRLWCIDAPDTAAARRMKDRAVSEGWAPVGAWDDYTIDDPAAVRADQPRRQAS